MFDAGKTRMIGLPNGEKNCDEISSRFHLIPERKGPFIATQFNSTRRRVEFSWVELHRYRPPHRRNSTVAGDRQCNWPSCSVQPISTSSWVESCRYKRAFTDRLIDRRTDRRTDRFAISISRVSMLTREKNDDKTHHSLQLEVVVVASALNYM